MFEGEAVEGKRTAPGALEAPVSQSEGTELVLTGRAARRLRQPVAVGVDRLVEHAPVGIQEIDAEGRCLRVNPAFCRMTGYLPAELQGRSMADLAAAPEYVERLRDLLYAGEGMDRFAMPLVRSDGSLLEALVTASVVPGEGTGPATLLAVVEDAAGELPDGEDPAATVESPVDAVEIVAAAVEHAREAAQDRGVAVAFIYPGEPLWIRADATEVGRELEHRLANAVRSIPAGALAVRCTSGDGGALVELVEVSDAGGIGADLAALFASDEGERYERETDAGRITLKLTPARR